MSRSCIFVYGTLLCGESNHARLTDAFFLGAASTEPRFELLDLAAYPGLVEGGSTAVMGEIYEVDEKVLAELDEYEGHPRLFRRSSIVLSDGRTVQTYLLVDAYARGHARIPSGDWRHRSARS